MADDQALSSMYVMLGLDTVNFSAGADRASKIADRTAGDIDKSFASISEGRGGLMLAENAIGIHVPSALNTLLSRIPAVQAAFSAMLPILGVAVAIEIIVKLIEHHEKLKEAAEQLKLAEEGVGHTTETVFNGLDKQLLEAGIKADDLRGKHLEALQKQLKLIDLQSMDQLEAEFGKLAKSADAVFALLKVSWYQFGSGSEGAKHSLEEFQAQYDKLLDTGKKDDAAALLDEKIKREERILALQKQEADSQAVIGVHAGNYAKFEEAKLQLQKLGVGFTKQEVEAEQTLVDILHAQATAAAKIAELNKDEHKNKTDETTVKVLEQTNKLADATIEGDKKIEDADVHLWEAKALLALSGVQKTADIDDQLTAIHIEATKRQYSNDMQAAVAHLNVLNSGFVKDKAAIEAAQDAIVALGKEFQTKETNEQSAGNNKRFAAQEEANRKQAELTQKLATENLRHTEEMSKLTLDEDKKAEDELVRTHQVTAAQDLANRQGFENRRYQIIVNGIAADRAAISADDADQEVKQAALDNKLEEEKRRHEAEMAAIGEAARKKEQTDIARSQNTIAMSIGQNVAKSIVEGKKLGDSMKKLGQQMLEEALANAIRLILIGKMSQIPDAAHAARKAFGSVYDALPFPINAVAAPIAAAAAFETAMSFDQGGIVPHDAMALVHKDEMVLPPHIAQAIMNSSGSRGGHTINVDARGADAGVEQRVLRAAKAMSDQAVARSVSAINDRAARRA
jgi:hypothetical protein